MVDSHATDGDAARRDERVIVRKCEACGELTAHERPNGWWSLLHESRYACVRCTGRRDAARRSLRRAWFDGRTIIDPL